MSLEPKQNFFEFRQQVAGRREKQPGKLDGADPKAEPLTVSQLTAQIERAIKVGVPNTVHVKGEASNAKLHHGSGHLYFTLKDAGACIDGIMFRSDVAKLKFTPEDGMELLVSGRIAIYPQRGRYQLYATSIAPLGRGALEVAFQQLCEKLEKEGLFDPERKRLLPRYPKRIALVTSQSTAALQDMLKVLWRFPWIELMLFHVPVQGDGSAERIAEALSLLSRGAKSIGGIDLILLSRGGGSMEDLWEFNEEIVARAIIASSIPVVTGIGHEVDVCIADLVADYHAHTPTEAAQVVTAFWKSAADQLHQAGARLWRGLRNLSSDSRHRLNAITRHEFFRRPTDRINQLRQLLDDRQRSLQLATGELLRRQTARLSRAETSFIECHPRHLLELKSQRLSETDRRLQLSMRNLVKQTEQHLGAMERHLHAISPSAVLQRGYTITTRKKDGAIVRKPADVKVGERIVTRLADGTIESQVQDQNQLPLFE